jgi:hypothetical protein
MTRATAAIAIGCPPKRAMGLALRGACSIIRLQIRT